MVNASLHGVLHYLGSLRDAQALTEAPDAQLLEWFSRGHEEAPFAALVRRHGPMVWSVARRVLIHVQDAEDVFQATFLLLARKAASIRKAESVGSWLHGVAHRLALKTRLQQARRRTREKRAADMRPTTTSEETSLSEVLAALDRVLGELPEKYRAALVLCYLEGHTQEEAARRLGCPLATVRTRLARGRKLLRDRLSNHGLTLSTAGLAALLIASAAPAAAPAVLVKAVVQAALAFAAGQSAAALCTEQAAGLVKGGLQAMVLTKAKMATMLLLAASLIATGAGVLAHQTLAAKEKGTPPATAKQSSPSPKGATKVQAAQVDDVKDSVTYTGRVLDPDSKAVAGAKVYYYFITHEDGPSPVRSTTDSDGRFTFTLTPKDVPPSARTSGVDPLKAGFIVVKADGFAFTWRLSRKPMMDLVFRLARDDTPIEGRILDLQGAPIPGVRVKVLGTAASDKDNLDDFLRALQKREDFYHTIMQQLPNYLHNMLIGNRDGVNLLPATTTDANGRFRIDGFAREQLVELRIEGPTIERKEFYVLTRDRPAKAANLLTPVLRSGEMYGPTEYTLIRWNGFDHAAAPGQVITGVVRDANTKAPLPGAVIESYQLAGTNLAQNTIYRTVADAQGRYRFTGLPRGKGNRIRIRPAPDRPYIPVVKDVPEKAALVEAVVDVELPAGVLVDVTAKDKKTGRPVPGCVSYFTFPDSPDPKIPFLSGPYADSYDNFMPIRNDGTFRFVAAPRRAILAFRADWTKYPIAREADTFRLPSGLASSNFQAFAEIHPTLGDEPVRVNFVLDTRGTATVRVVGPHGQPLPGAVIGGLRHDWFTDRDLPFDKTQSEFTVLGLDPKHPRLLGIVHMSKKLAGSVVVRGDENAPVTVRLQPWASVKGRLLDAEGRPIKNAPLRFTEVPPVKPGHYRALDAGIHLVERIGGRPDPDPHTDAEGNFQVDGLIPGLKYNLAYVDMSRAFSFDQIAWKGLAFSGLVLKPAETRNLGDVKLQPFPKE